MTDNELLAQILRRFLLDKTVWVNLYSDSLLLDGYVELSEDERQVIERVTVIL